MKTILILEDNAREMERLVKIVREQGAQNEVICAVNLEQAIIWQWRNPLIFFC